MPTGTERRNPGTAAAVAEQFEDIGQQRRADWAGMWVFLATEMLLFGGLFAGYAVYRVEYAAAFAAAATRLDLALGAINTGLLLTSGLAMAMVEPAMARGSRRAVVGLLVAAAALGIAFLGIKGVEYHHEISKSLAPIAGLEFRYDGPQPAHAQMFFNFYFAMTGLHALHMLAGIGAIGVMVALTLRWREPARLGRQLGLVALYWAFVDAVWLLLFPALYLLRG